jgi:hypothetical protein
VCRDRFEVGGFQPDGGRAARDRTRPMSGVLEDSAIRRSATKKPPGNVLPGASLKPGRSGWTDLRVLSRDQSMQGCRCCRIPVPNLVPGASVRANAALSSAHSACRVWSGYLGCMDRVGYWAGTRRAGSGVVAKARNLRLSTCRWQLFHLRSGNCVTSAVDTGSGISALKLRWPRPLSPALWRSARLETRFAPFFCRSTPSVFVTASGIKFPASGPLNPSTAVTPERRSTELSRSTLDTVRKPAEKPT